MFVPFDRTKIRLLPLAERQNDLDRSVILPVMPASMGEAKADAAFAAVAERILLAKKRGAAVIFMMGAHVLRSGVQRYLIDLIRRGYVTCVAVNGACVIHDFELALLGATTESVANYIRDGRFGMWQETGGINDIVTQAARDGKGLGEAVGQAIAAGDFPYADDSLFAACAKTDTLATVHVSLGQDIIHQHANCDGAAIGKTSYLDFLRYAHAVENLEGGVVMNFGSAVMAPEVFLKALSMARNVAATEGREIRHFTTLVCDLQDLPADISAEAPKNSAAYYFRPWKTMLVRTVADGGQSHYVRGEHKRTLPALWTAITNLEGRHA